MGQSLSVPKSLAQFRELKRNPPHNPNIDLVKSIGEQAEMIKEQTTAIQQQQGGLQALTESVEKLIPSLPATEVHYGTIVPDNPVHGDLWYHSDENRLYVYVEE